MIELINISKSYKENKALKSINLKVKKGEFLGLVGPNGAGKTTTLNIMSSYLSATSGKIIFDGKEVKSFSKQDKLKIGYIPQELSIYDDLTAEENMNFWGKIYEVKGQNLKDRIDILLKNVGLISRKNDAVNTFSGGMKRRLNIAVGLIHNPDFLFLDEPTVGVDPQSRNFIFEMVEKLHKEGKTILYTSHYMEEVERLCNRIAIIDNGVIVAKGTQDELIKSVDNNMRLEILLEHEISEIKIVDENDNVEIENNTIRVTGKNLSCRIKDYLSEIKENDIINISFKKMTLEELFLKLTGKDLRE